MILTSEPKRQVLLTGAGFTKNFGGFLADEMWAEILNDPLLRTHTIFRDVLRNTLDFEAVYEQVMKGGRFFQGQRSAFHDVVRRAYERMDNILRGRISRVNELRPPWETRLWRFIDDTFGRHGDRPGFFFTLNQDLLIERGFDPRLPEPTPLGVRSAGSVQHHVAVNRISKIDLVEEDDVPSSESEVRDRVREDLKASICYVKLHGSYRWGPQMLVLGHNKDRDVKGNPLLAHYHELLKEVLSHAERRVLIIGYGFRDPYINCLLAEMSLKHRHEIYIVCPLPPREFRERVLLPSPDPRGGSDRHYRDQIWRTSVCGYCPHDLEQLFSTDALVQQLTEALSD